jgi:hypothetical protein
MKITLLKTTILLFALTLSNCENNDPQDQLPPITQTGANTFGAIVDGRPFVPKGTISFNPLGTRNKELGVFVGSDFFDKNGDDKWFITTFNSEDNPNTYIYIYLPTLVNSPKDFIIKKSDGSERNDLPNAHIYCLINKGEFQYLSFENSGVLNFSKIDIVNGFYAGTFNVKLKNKDDENDMIQITDGRFDINLNTVNK